MSKDSNKSLSFKDFILFLIGWIKKIFKSWVFIIVFIVLGIISGFLYSYLTPAKYIAETNFVLSEKNQEQVNPLAIFGLGGDSEAGLFEGDNLLWLYSSSYMLKETLLYDVKDENNSSKILINWFLEIDPEMIEYIGKLKEEGVVVDFPNGVSKDSLNRNQNRVINYAITIINRDYLVVKNVAKTTGIINVTITSKNELFSKYFCDILVNSVNSYYVNTKTKKANKQVLSLQSKVEGMEQNTKKAMYKTAKAVENIPYPNPNLKTIHVEEQHLGVDASINTGMYTMLAQQLEKAELALSEVTPLIQIVDYPAFPLKISKPSIKLMPVVGAFVFFVLSIIIIIIRIFFKSLKEE